MRPRSLRMENFGAYRAPAIVDFSALGPLFLVWGKTGSGKTTLFDAITYALYGAVSGSRRKLDRDLVSHYAKPGDRPVVEFEFSLGDEDWKVLRSPPWRRPGRGGKEVEVPPEAVLSRREGDRWVLVADKKSEVDEALGRALSLSLDEFSKIVLLPQGEFQRFLEMDSGERVEILEKLFPVDLHGAVTALARERTKAAQAELDRIQADLARLGAEGGEGPGPGELEGLEAGLALLEEARARAHEAAVGAEAALRQGEEARARHLRAIEAQAALDGLEAEAPAAAERRDRITLARRAAAVLPVLEAEAEAAAALAAAEAAQAAREARLAELEAGAAGAEARRAEAVRAQAGLAELDGQAGALRQALEAWRKAQAARQARDAAALAAAAAEAGLRQAQEAEASAAEAAARLGFPQEEEEGLSAAREAARLGLEEATRLEALVLELESRREGAAQAAETEAAAAQGLDRARKSFEAYEAGLVRDQAGHLAQGLAPGQACPVCGSLDHPNPARLSDGPGRPGEAEALRKALDRAIATAAAAAQASDAARAALEVAGLRLEEAQAGPGAVDAQAAAALRLAAAATLAEAQARLEDLGRRRRGRDAALASLESRRKKREEAAAIAAKAGQDLAACEAGLAAVVDQGGHEDPGPALEALAARRAELARAGATAQAAAETWARERQAAEARLLEIREGLPQAREALERRRALAQKALAGADFGSPQDARLAALEARELSRLEADQLSFEHALAQARAAAGEALRARGSGPLPDLGALEAGRDASRQAYLEAQAAYEAAKEGLGSRRRQAEALERLGAERRAVQERTRLLVSLSTLLSGDISGRRLPFKSFVLGLYFREVVDRASLRLGEMSEGRYALAMDEAQTSGRGRTGLDILVQDSQTGRPRPPGTLSGGERFLTALALALALADTIRSRSGGVNLDAVFIDEGFGSLDEEALDRAIAALDRARGARLIGIVSHVQELRTRIPSRIEVSKGRGGSRLEIV